MDGMFGRRQVPAADFSVLNAEAHAPRRERAKATGYVARAAGWSDICVVSGTRSGAVGTRPKLAVFIRETVALFIQGGLMRSSRFALLSVLTLAPCTLADTVTVG